MIERERGISKDGDSKKGEEKRGSLLPMDCAVI